jgi:CRP-like cAMP-binding protein
MSKNKVTAAAGEDFGRLLATTGILNGLPQATLDRIVAIVRPVAISEGQTFYSVGDPARSVYVVVKGRLRFTLGGDGRPEANGSIIPAGDILGWAALLTDQPRRIATVVCLEDSLLLDIDGKSLLNILEEQPRAGYIVMQRLAKMITQSFLEQSSKLTLAS